MKPETALLARVFAEYCITQKYENKMEATMPVLTQMVFYIQAQYNVLLDLLQKADTNTLQGDDNSENATFEDDIAYALFTTRQLLQLSHHMDFSDEIGRRKLFVLIRTY